MALQINLDESASGIGAVAPEAYARIVIYTHDIKGDSIQFAVEYHYNAAARQNARNPIKGAAFRATEAELNAFPGGIRAQMYGWLETLPEFAGAVDV